MALFELMWMHFNAKSKWSKENLVFQIKNKNKKQNKNKKKKTPCYPHLPFMPRGKGLEGSYNLSAYIQLSCSHTTKSSKTSAPVD